MSAPAPLFEAVEVVREFRSASRAPVRALDGVSVAVPRGAFAVVTGPSGGGKTTLLALLGALDRPTTGRVRFDGRDLHDASPAALARLRRRLGFVFQDSPMLRHVAAWENVVQPLLPLGVPAAERRRRGAEVLARVGLSDRAASLAEELSAGERQRVGIARALVAEPEAVLADEPTAHLDRESADEVVRLLGEAHASGRTVLVTTHDPAVLALATRRIGLRGGRLVPAG